MVPPLIHAHHNSDLQLYMLKLDDFIWTLSDFNNRNILHADAEGHVVSTQKSE